jgi:hypothetical protein
MNGRKVLIAVAAGVIVAAAAWYQFGGIEPRPGSLP